MHSVCFKLTDRSLFFRRMFLGLRQNVDLRLGLVTPKDQ